MKIADKNEFEKQNVFGTGTPNTAYAKYFIGESYLNSLTKFLPRLSIGTVLKRTAGSHTSQWKCRAKNVQTSGANL